MTLAWFPTTAPGALSGYVVTHGIFHLLSLRRKADVRRCLYEPHFLSEFADAWPDVAEPLRSARVAGLEALCAHYEILLGLDERCLVVEFDLDVCSRVAEFIRECGDIEVTYQITKSIYLQAQTSNNLGDTDLAGFRESLAVAAAETLRCDEAEALYQELLSFQAHTCGDPSAEVCLTLFNMASLADRKGEVEEASGGYLRTLHMSERVHGEAHEMTVLSTTKLADALITLDRIDEAACYLQRAQRRSAALPEGLPWGYELLLDCAVVDLMKAQGRQEQAIASSADIVQRMQQRLGRTHPETLDEISSLGRLLKNSERYSEAEPLLREASESLARLGEAGRQKCVTAQTGLALLLVETDRSSEALELMRHVIEEARCLFGPGHHRVASALLTAGMAALHADDASLACRYFEEAVNVYSSSLGEDSGLALSARHYWSKGLYEAGHYEQAVAQLQIVTARESEAACEGDSVSAVTHWELARCYRKLGRPDDAARYREVCWKLECDTDGAGSSAALQTAHALARDFLEAGRRGEAQETLDAALAAAAAAHEEDEGRAARVAKLRQLRSSF